MNLAEALDQVEAELAGVQLEHERTAARIRGLTAERDALVTSIQQAEARRARPQSAVDLNGMTKDRAIVAVLRGSPEPIGVAELQRGLEIGGRPNENPNTISVYLNTLLKQGRVERTGRGLYRATS